MLTLPIAETICVPTRVTSYHGNESEAYQAHSQYHLANGQPKFRLCVTIWRNAVSITDISHTSIVLNSKHIKETENGISAKWDTRFHSRLTHRSLSQNKQLLLGVSHLSRTWARSWTLWFRKVPAQLQTRRSWHQRQSPRQGPQNGRRTVSVLDLRRLATDSWLELSHEGRGNRYPWNHLGCIRWHLREFDTGWTENLHKQLLIAMIKVDHNVKARKRLARKVYFVSEGQLLGFIADSPGPPFVNGVPICTNNAVPMVPMLLNLSTKAKTAVGELCLPPIPISCMCRFCGWQNSKLFSKIAKMPCKGIPWGSDGFDCETDWDGCSFPNLGLPCRFNGTRVQRGMALWYSHEPKAKRNQIRPGIQQTGSVWFSANFSFILQWSRYVVITGSRRLFTRHESYAKSGRE